MEARDLEEVARLSEQLGYPISVEDLRTRFETITHAPDHALYVAEGDDLRVVGWIFLRRELSPIEPARAVVGSLVVDSEQQGRGIGRLLMKRAEAWAQEQGLERVWLSSQTKREAAHRFYEKLGYRIRKTSYFLAKEL